ncbi:hypothetical protein SeMB42_g01659 [Synchytrium endobioticum]|uniref:Thioredoxin domain-containing protein n=1 Tax=Synchytrium endobioticum TaxID=286115 RepID=A0A507CTX6_9FUNG|nr:hypothetical protein SeLEV6574_g05509 [Synchytrium endobioticum]TPX52070.1 hypothetical protein SeMB42_g01659 [Synchytrium endobioticum]
MQLSRGSILITALALFTIPPFSATNAPTATDANTIFQPMATIPSTPTDLHLVPLLDAATWNDSVTANTTWIILFGATWCRYTNKFLPSLASVYTQTINPRATVHLAIGRVMCSTTRGDVLNFCSDKLPNLAGFPTIGLYKNGLFLEEYIPDAKFTQPHFLSYVNSLIETARNGTNASTPTESDDARQPPPLAIPIGIAGSIHTPAALEPNITASAQAKLQPPVLTSPQSLPKLAQPAPRVQRPSPLHLSQRKPKHKSKDRKVLGSEPDLEPPSSEELNNTSRNFLNPLVHKSITVETTPFRGRFASIVFIGLSGVALFGIWRMYSVLSNTGNSGISRRKRKPGLLPVWDPAKIK